MSIGEKIYNLRKSKNMSQETLANMLNVSRQTISKWETGESNPDFDKIVPLCDFFEISTDELLRGTNNYLEQEIVLEKNKNKALTISLCIIIFVIMIVLVLIFDEIGGNDTLTGSIVVVALGAIAVILVNYFCSKPISDKKNRISLDNKKRKLINSIINMITVIIYFGVSFIFVSWSISWIIFIVGALTKRIVELIIMLGENNNEE